ncbi:hypothetical protein HDA40_006104 [Hamadaea flava]|uniref:Uncharacterized protein n=1 Tax=Hamadaea flava TaxID=1742688 RepID=A0ABV8LW71_9ACTN|nr:hypothetical protein [Hamadaea flava]MCP2327597.1 hypothetical protein [Hamadaea flava]
MNPFPPNTSEHEAWERQSVAGTAAVDKVHEAFNRWLGKEYDLDALDAVLCTAAAERLDGDPVWLLVVSGSGNAKTETVGALAGAGAAVTSTVASEGALLSATSHKDKAKDATGGLLRKIGDEGLLVIKDFTSILSMNRDLRATVLAALREVYDGKWERNVGTDGGRTLTWAGRIVLVGAVTTAYDQAHGVIASMGDRFALVRMDSTAGRASAGRQALANVGHEVAMRKELADAVSEVMAGLYASAAVLGDEDMDVLLTAADLVTLSRTAVERDFRGDPIEAHAPEMPTRFAKMLGQILRGGLALGMRRCCARRIALRVARDSVPPLRAAILADVAKHPVTPTREVVKRVQRPRTTVDRTLQELHLIGLLQVEDGGYDTAWHYRLAEGVEESAVRRLLLNDHAYQECHKGSVTLPYPNTRCSDKSGEQDQLREARAPW